MAWPETGGMGRSRSQKMAPFDRQCTTFYWSAIVNIVLFGTVFELFDVEWYHDLEIWVRGHSRSFKPVPFESLSAVSYSPSIVTIGWKSWFFHTPCIRRPVRGSPSEYCHPVWCGKTRVVGLSNGEKIFEDTYFYNRLDNTGMRLTNRWTERRTDILWQHSPASALCIRVAQ